MQISKHWFWGVLLKYAPLYWHVLVASIIVNILSLAMPLFVMNVYDRIVPNNAFESLWVLTIGIVLATLIDLTLRIVRTYFVDIVGRNADVKLQDILFNTLSSVRLDELHKNNSTSTVGAIMARVRELEHVREFLSSNTILAIVDLPFTMLFIALIFYLGGPLGFVAVVTIPLMFLFSASLQSLFKRANQEQMVSSAHKNSFLTELVNGLETVRVSNMQRHLEGYWHKVISNGAEANIKSRRLSSIHISVIMFFNVIASVSIVVLGVYRISEGFMSMGALIACMIILGRCANPMTNIVHILVNYQKMGMALKELDVLINLPNENQVASDLSESDQELVPKITAKSVPISFENVSFTYPSQGAQVTALKDINITINSFAKLGIVGASGSGKSSFARLCAGLYLPTQGRVMYGNLNSANAPMQAVRRGIGFMPQQIHLFRGTLRHNIALSWPHEGVCPEEEIIKVATIAGVMDYANEHPLGLDMPIGEQGRGLSVGQGQCIALARALLGNPHTIILDEPVAHIDNASELRLVERLTPFVADKTLMIFTHKATILRLVNDVIALEKGKLIWSGPRQEAVKGA